MWSDPGAGGWWTSASYLYTPLVGQQLAGAGSCVRSQRSGSSNEPVVEQSEGIQNVNKEPGEGRTVEATCIIERQVKKSSMKIQLKFK